MMQSLLYYHHGDVLTWVVTGPQVMVGPHSVQVCLELLGAQHLYENTNEILCTLLFYILPSNFLRWNLGEPTNDLIVDILRFHGDPGGVLPTGKVGALVRPLFVEGL